MSALEQLLEQAAAKEDHRTGLNLLIKWLSQFDSQDVDVLCRSEGKPSPPPSRSKTSAEIDVTLVDSYVANLRQVMGDRPRFEAVMSQIKADKKLRIGELSEIAKCYVGGTNKYKSKADALKEIKLRFDAGMNAARRSDATSEIF